MKTAFLLAAALCCLVEGALPFLSPARFRIWLLMLIQMSDVQIRLMGALLLLSAFLFALSVRVSEFS
jgi:uncharacterized protein YjeT (DUF2065 family)